MPPLRQIFAGAVVVFFVGYVFISAVAFNVNDVWTVSQSPLNAIPDFSRYRDLRTLSESEFPIDDPHKRTIVIGDIHGMYDQLKHILKKLHYDERKDTLVSAGDIIAKGSLRGSLDVLSYMADYNITAVRGNHDQKVIEWRSWLEWAHLSGGSKWLNRMDNMFDEFQASLPPSDREDDDIIEDWVEQVERQLKKRDRKWWDRIPSGWKIFGDHYRIAKAMSSRQYDYLVSLPLRIHAPHAHTFVVHAGLLSSDPSKPNTASSQPLASVPVLPKHPISYSGKDTTKLLRELQETAVLNEIPQNRDPWTTLNMRGIMPDKKVTRSKEGTPWADVYNADVALCNGFVTTAGHKKKLPCYPPTVLYGHAASRGLDINRWTIGLDSGCVYNKRLTTLVLGGKYAKSLNYDYLAALQADETPTIEDNDYDAESGAFDKHGKKKSSVIRFGDRGRGRIVSVSCT